MIDLFLIPAGAALAISGEIIGRELIGGKTVLVNLAEKQSLIMWNLEPETVKPADTEQDLLNTLCLWSIHFSLFMSLFVVSLSNV